MDADGPIAQDLQQLRQREIVWLKPAEDVDHGFVFLSGLNLDCMNHPVLVVRVDRIRQVAEVCIVSSNTLIS
jgi:hypothetical protein